MSSERSSWRLRENRKEESLLLSQRKALHEKAGAALEALHADRLEEHYDRLAEHMTRRSARRVC